jgi:hypothetical protein
LQRSKDPVLSDHPLGNMKESFFLQQGKSKLEIGRPMAWFTSLSEEYQISAASPSRALSLAIAADI